MMGLVLLGLARVRVLRGDRTPFRRDHSSECGTRFALAKVLSCGFSGESRGAPPVRRPRPSGATPSAKNLSRLHLDRRATGRAPAPTPRSSATQPRDSTAGRRESVGSTAYDQSCVQPRSAPARPASRTSAARIVEKGAFADRWRLPGVSCNWKRVPPKEIGALGRVLCENSTMHLWVLEIETFERKAAT